MQKCLVMHVYEHTQFLIELYYSSSAFGVVEMEITCGHWSTSVHFLKMTTHHDQAQKLSIQH